MEEKVITAHRWSGYGTRHWKFGLTTNWKVMLGNDHAVCTFLASSVLSLATPITV